MKKNSKGQAKKTSLSTLIDSESTRVVDLGVCKDFTCSYFNPSETHSHGLAYRAGLLNESQCRDVADTLKSLGFIGEIEVTVVSRKQFLERVKNHFRSAR